MPRNCGVFFHFYVDFEWDVKLPVIGMKKDSYR